MAALSLVTRGGVLPPCIVAHAIPPHLKTPLHLKTNRISTAIACTAPTMAIDTTSTDTLWATIQTAYARYESCCSPRPTHHHQGPGIRRMPQGRHQGRAAARPPPQHQHHPARVVHHQRQASSPTVRPPPPAHLPPQQPIPALRPGHVGLRPVPHPHAAAQQVQPRRPPRARRDPRLSAAGGDAHARRLGSHAQRAARNAAGGARVFQRRAAVGGEPAAQARPGRAAAAG